MTATTRRALLGTGAALSLSSPALAFPDRPLRIISGFNPGGANDIVSRALAQPLTAVLGQPVVVENRAGAGGGVGALAAARAAPDGYTMFMGIVDTQAINPLTYRNLAYDPERDFAPVSLVATIPFAVVAGPSRPEIKDFAGLVAAAKRAPGALSFGSWGVGSTAHLAFARIAREAEAELLHVPFTGQAPAMQAVAASQVDVMAVPAGGAEAMARDGRARVLAVISPQRLELLPAAPTLRELGVDLVIGLWQALYVPARTPPAVVARLNAAAREAMRAPSFAAAMRTQAAKPEPSTPEALAELQRSEREAYGVVVRALNITVDGA
ncbi:tripartite tricarboxylate transporter substrate binding protein [Craurococcus roseus]|uniref:Tripartite tricarboxylate transporter substrate binding protein n=1 Tax=Craurococcus roseus TaxID=77585 RepID=A0ABN1EN62_9PROT